MIKYRDSFKYCTNCKTELEERKSYKVCPNCHKEYYFNPGPTVNIILSNRDGEILLVKREREPYKEWWDLPGGFVEANENLEEAIARELKEETNLVATDLTYLGSFDEVYEFKGEEIPIFTAGFSGKVDDISHIAVDDDASDYKFVSLDEIVSIEIAFKHQNEFLHKHTK